MKVFVAGASGAIEPLGESTASSQPLVLSPYNVNAQYIRTRIWDGKDNYFTDNLTKLKGAHLIQFGGQFQHNFNYHQRTDNGASINYTPTYQIGGDATGGNIAYSASGIGGVATTGNYRRIADTYYGLVTATQVANTYTNSGGNLSLNAPLTDKLTANEVGQVAAFLAIQHREAQWWRDASISYFQSLSKEPLPEPSVEERLQKEVLRAARAAHRPACGAS